MTAKQKRINIRRPREIDKAITALEWLQKNAEVEPSHHIRELIYDLMFMKIRAEMLAQQAKENP
jgi:hypothetical protein